MRESLPYRNGVETSRGMTEINSAMKQLKIVKWTAGVDGQTRITDIESKDPLLFTLDYVEDIDTFLRLTWDLFHVCCMFLGRLDEEH